MGGEFIDLILRANFAAAVAIVGVLSVRTLIAQRFGSRVAYALWWTPLLAAIASALPARRLLVEAIPTSAAPAALPAASADVAAPIVASAAFDPAAAMISLWLAGAAAFLALLVWRQLRFGRSLGRLTREAGVYRAAASGVGPALVGTLTPRIVLPADFEARFSAEERALVLDHERTHLRRGDHLVNGLVAALQCLNWFNPLIHLAAFHLRLDQELACDAAVIARRPHERRSYAEAMLKTQISPAAVPLGCHWPARGAHPLKLRIAMLGQRLPSRPQTAVGLALVAALCSGAGVAAWAAQPPRIEVTPARAARQPEVVRVAVAAEAPLRAQTAAHAQAVAAADAESLETIEAARAAAAPEEPPVRDHVLDRALQRAARSDDVALAQRMVAAGADVNRHIPGDPTPLVEAAGRGHLATMRYLLDHGADVNRPAPGDGNALIRAAGRGQYAAAELLVARGADVDAFVPGDETPLINAARAGDLAMVKFLVERGADVNLAVSAHSWNAVTRSPMSVARDPRIRSYLKSRGATP